MALARDTSAPTDFAAADGYVFGYDSRLGGSKLGWSFGAPVGGTATAAKTKTYSYGIDDPSLKVTTSAPISYGASVPKIGATGILSSMSNFLATMSMGNAAPTPTTSRTLGMSGSGMDPSGTGGMPAATGNVGPIPKVHTVDVDGGTDVLSKLKTAATGILGAMGSSGDGGVVAQPVGLITTPQKSGVNPMLVLGAALAVGGAYYAFAK